MKFLNRALLAASLTIATTSAFADTTFNIGSLSSTAYVNTNNVSGAFTDTYNFTINAASLGSASVADIDLSLNNINFLNINGLTLQLFDSNNTLISGITDVALSAGSYYAQVSGTTTGLNGGSYLFSAVAAPVPEPAMLSLMVSGAGLMGFVSYRRRKMA